MRCFVRSLSPRAEKAAFVALIVLFYAVLYAADPGAFPGLLVDVLLFAAGYVPGYALARLAPSPRPTRLLTAALAVAALAVFFALPLFVGPYLGEVGRGLLIGSFVGTFLDRRER